MFVITLGSHLKLPIFSPETPSSFQTLRDYLTSSSCLSSWLLKFPTNKSNERNKSISFQSFKYFTCHDAVRMKSFLIKKVFSVN